MGLFGIDIENGILFPDGWFRTGNRPSVGRPLAEIYAVTDRDDSLDLWFLVAQERLSRAPRWKDDYFQIWAEALAFRHAGETFVGELWVVVVFDAAGNPVTRVNYWPVFAGDRMDDVAYADATDTLRPTVPSP
jgi:hypothetical protein